VEGLLTGQLSGAKGAKLEEAVALRTKDESVADERKLWTRFRILHKTKKGGTAWPEEFWERIEKSVVS